MVEASTPSSHDPGRTEYTLKRIAHWDAVALRPRATWGDYYHRRLEQIYQDLVPPGQKVLEVGCATGDLLAALAPSEGVGVDLSGQMVHQAREKYPKLSFVHADIHGAALEGTFDTIILSDVVNDLWDVQQVFERIKAWCSPRTRIILNSYSRVWQPQLTLVRALGLATPLLPQNWLTAEDMTNLLSLADLEVVRKSTEILFPLDVPLLARLCNRYLVKFAPFRWFALTHVLVARVRPTPAQSSKGDGVSVVIPARNEEGNIERIITSVPDMGAHTELVFVEGHSTDNTYAAIQEAVKAHPERSCQVLKQTGKGKGDAVRLGFSCAQHNILMILDADLTVPPSDLPRFYEALVSGQGEFINGVRLVYPMEDKAMQFCNVVGNRFFSLAFSWLLGQPIKDTLCGTKVLWKRDYERIAADKAFFARFDPFGDFDLLFGAAKLSLKLLDMPVRYRQRTYGETNIQRWRHGWLLLKMVVHAARRVKFV
ncbi:MAG: glycosyltransferase [Thermodesulfobacteriota bacterium]